MSWAGLDDFLSRARTKLAPLDGPERFAETGDVDFLTEERAGNLRRAGVLIGIIPREDGPTMLLTKRPATMAEHAGPEQHIALHR